MRVRFLDELESQHAKHGHTKTDEGQCSEVAGIGDSPQHYGDNPTRGDPDDVTHEISYGEKTAS